MSVALTPTPAPHPLAWPAWVDDLFRQGDAARKAGRHALALAIYRRVVAAAPDHVPALQHLGGLLTVLGRRAEAEGVLAQAHRLNPQDPLVRHALAMTLMAQGRYPEASRLYEARFEIPALGILKPHGLPFPEWRGEDLAGKRLLIVGEMGFGDQIQHARFVPVLQAMGAEVVFVCRPGLVGLFAESFPGALALPGGQPAEMPQPDCWTMSSSLMGILGVTPDTLPAAPYLHTPEGRPGKPAAGFTVGVITAGNPAHGNDAWRSLSPDQAARLRQALPGQVVELAPEASGAADFAATAALIAPLDLVVSVDTAVAHLAGAMGKRAFVLIPDHNTDWRWMHEREDSPWYPTMRLYRADPKTGWAPAIERLAADVRALAAGEV